MQLILQEPFLFYTVNSWGKLLFVWDFFNIFILKKKMVMSKYFKTLLLIACAFYSKTSLAQQLSNDVVDVNSTFQMRTNMDPRSLEQKYSGVDGKPYLTDDFVKGNVATKDGVILKNVLLRFDQVEQNLLMKEEGNKILAFKDALLGFSIELAEGTKPLTFETGFASGSGTSEKTIFETFNKGNARLLRTVKKSIDQSRGYGGAIAKSVTQITKYYISIGKKNSPTELKLEEKSILKVLGADNDVNMSYIKENKLNLKKLEDVIAFLDFYNSTR